MTLTCYRCPTQICFHGDWRRRSIMARLFGWARRGGALLLRSVR